MNGDKDTQYLESVDDRRGQAVHPGDEVWFFDQGRMFTGCVLIIAADDHEITVAIGSVIGAKFRHPGEIERRPKYA